MKKVTVIIPVYNSEKYIGKCIKSIIDQTYKNLDILVINDGSKDNSLSVIKSFTDKRIRVIDKKNEGVSKTRNLGIKKSTGDYIMFVDNDDYLDKECIEEFVKSIKNNDIAIGGYKRVNDKKEMFRCVLKNTKWSKYIIMSPWAKLFKREFLINNNISFLNHKIGEDIYFNLLAFSKTNKIVILSNCSYNWYYNVKSVSNTVQKGLNSDIDILKLVSDLIKIDGFLDDELNCYYVYRYLVWYLLFSSRNANSKQFISEYNRLKNWYDKHINKKIISSLSPKIYGERLEKRTIILIFIII